MVKKGSTKRMSGAEIESNNRRVHDKGIEKDLKLKIKAREKKIKWAESNLKMLEGKGITQAIIDAARKDDDKAYTLIRRLFDKKCRFERKDKKDKAA